VYALKTHGSGIPSPSSLSRTTNRYSLRKFELKKKPQVATTVSGKIIQPTIPPKTPPLPKILMPTTSSTSPPPLSLGHTRLTYPTPPPKPTPSNTPSITLLNITAYQEEIDPKTHLPTWVRKRPVLRPEQIAEWHKDCSIPNCQFKASLNFRLEVG
jgi:hypothetical protein